MPSNKETYISFYKTGKVYIPIFSQPWWLEASTGGNWDVIVAYEGSNVVAFMPYYYIDNGDGSFEIRKEHITQNNGIIFNPPLMMKEQSLYAFKRKASLLIISELEKLNLTAYRQYFHYSFTNWLPFYWHGYTQTTRYTFVISSFDIDEITKGLDSTLRNQIKKADKSLSINYGMDIDIFYDLCCQTFARQGLPNPDSFKKIKELYELCKKRQCGTILYATDSDGNIHSAIYLVEDNQSVYYILSGSNSDYRSSNSVSLLLFYGIKHAVQKHKKFDFEGSMRESVEHHFSQFGGKQMPYFDIRKVFSR